MGVKSKIAVAASTLLLGASALTLLTPSSAEASALVYSKETEGQDTVTLAPGEYEIEAWGGAGGWYLPENSRGGYGGYVKAKLTVTESTTLYITVGGMGSNAGTEPRVNAYNGGGNNTDDEGGGGGATHIATKMRGSGYTTNYESYKDDLLIVVGAGSGAVLKHKNLDPKGFNGGGLYAEGGTPGECLSPGCEHENREVDCIDGNGEGGQQNRGGATGVAYEEWDAWDGPHCIHGEGAGSFGKGAESAGAGWYGGGAERGKGTRSGAGSSHINDSYTGLTVITNGKQTDYLGAGKVVITSLHSHHYTWVTITSPTCTTAGSKVYKCTGTATDAGCDHIDKTEAIPALGHAWPTDYSYADNNGITNGLAYKNCTRTGCGVRLDTKWLNRIRVRYQNADGTYGSYTNAVNGYYYSGQTISWSRAADGAYQYAGTSWTSTAQAKSVDLTVYRNSYTLTLNKGIGISAVSGAGAKLYGASATIDATVKPGYTWKDWTGTTTYTTKNQSFNMPAYNVTLTANATPNPDTPYIVKHWVQRITATSTEENEINYELVLTENKTGTTDTSVTPPVNSYEGCISPAAQTVNINGDGSTVVNYYYTRVKVTLDVDGEYLAEHFDTTAGLCTFDVYINDILVADDETDYFNDQILYGSTWRIYDINPVGGKHYNGNKTEIFTE